MITPRSPQVDRRSERGSALIGVLLLLMLMSALAAAMGASGETETLISRNQRSGAEAQAAAEAGLNHAVQLAISYIFEWKANGFASPEVATDALLRGADDDAATTADNNVLGERPGIDEGEAIPLEGLFLNGSTVLRYEASIMDDDAYAPAGDPLRAENGVDTDDGNMTLLVRATGYGPDNTKVSLEAMISSFPMPAIVTNGDLTVEGSFAVTGDAGSVHTNSNLTGDGSAGTIEGTATASGTYDYDDPDIAGTGGAAEVPIPTVAANDYHVFALEAPVADDPSTPAVNEFEPGGYILTDGGTMVEGWTGNVVCTWVSGTPCNEWNFDAGTGGWHRSGNSSTGPGTYYVEGPATVTGSPGSNAAPFALTIVAEGSISLSGSPTLKPATPGLLFVTDGDLRILGDTDIVGASLLVQGKMMAHEQVDIGGTASLIGMVVAEDAVNNDNLVNSNHIHGNASIDYDGGLGGEFFSVSGWRDVR